jgi:AraC-like DNA-binding protein
MFQNIMREITPLTQNDCFTIISRHKEEFSFPIHSHEEMELNLVLGAPGARRVIGDHMEEIGEKELVLISANLPHGWFTHHCASREISEVTIQFNKDLLGEDLLKKTQCLHIKSMFECAKKGILFSEKSVDQVSSRLLGLSGLTGFDSVLELFSILGELASDTFRMLSDRTFTTETYNYNSRRLERVFEYLNDHYKKDVTLADVSRLAHMPETSFSRFIKHRTGMTFTENLTEIRLGHVSRMLITSTQSVAEIAYRCGFKNMSNFNRVFRDKKGCTPSEFRRDYHGHRIFV